MKRYLRITIFSIVSVILTIVVKKYLFNHAVVNILSIGLMVYTYCHFFGKKENDDYFNAFFFIVAIHTLIFSLYSVFITGTEATEFIGSGVVSWCVTIWHELNRNKD